MRISDWSSDVCSSDLLQFLPQPALSQVPGTGPRRVAGGPPGRAAAGALVPCRLHAAGPGRRDRLPEQGHRLRHRSEEHTSELQSLMRISYAVFCLNKQKKLHMHRRLITYNRTSTTDKRL